MGLAGRFSTRLRVNFPKLLLGLTLLGLEGRLQHLALAQRQQPKHGRSCVLQLASFRHKALAALQGNLQGLEDCNLQKTLSTSNPGKRLQGLCRMAFLAKAWPLGAGMWIACLCHQPCGTLLASKLCPHWNTGSMTIRESPQQAFPQTAWHESFAPQRTASPAATAWAHRYTKGRPCGYSLAQVPAPSATNRRRKTRSLLGGTPSTQSLFGASRWQNMVGLCRVAAWDSRWK